MGKSLYQYTCTTCGRAITEGEEAIASLIGKIGGDGGFKASWAGGPQVRHANFCDAGSWAATMPAGVSGAGTIPFNT